MNFLNVKAAQPKAGAITVDVSGATVPVPAGDAATAPTVLGIRPEHIGIGDGGANLGRARVQLVEQLGGSTLVYATLADGQPVTLELEGQKRVLPDEEMTLSVDPSRCHLFDDGGRSLALA